MQVQDLVVRYRADLDPVLRNLSFHVPARTKVCFVVVWVLGFGIEFARLGLTFLVGRVC